jgi:hypothetical protein
MTPAVNQSQLVNRERCVMIRAKVIILISLFNRYNINSEVEEFKNT